MLLFSSGWLARFDLDINALPPADDDRLDLDWVQASSKPLDDSNVRMTFLHGAQVAVILHSTMSGPEIALHHATDLSRVDARVMAVSLPPTADEKHCCASVAASARAIAAEVDDLGKWIFAVDSSSTLGSRLFRALGLFQPCFSQTGFLAGRVRDELRVLDALTGACLVAVANIWACVTTDEEPPSPTLSWAGRLQPAAPEGWCSWALDMCLNGPPWRPKSCMHARRSVCTVQMYSESRPSTLTRDSGFCLTQLTVWVTLELHN